MTLPEIQYLGYLLTKVSASQFDKVNDPLLVEGIWKKLNTFRGQMPQLTILHRQLIQFRDKSLKYIPKPLSKELVKSNLATKELSQHNSMFASVTKLVRHVFQILVLDDVELFNQFVMPKISKIIAEDPLPFLKLSAMAGAYEISRSIVSQQAVNQTGIIEYAAFCNDKESFDAFTNLYQGQVCAGILIEFAARVAEPFFFDFLLQKYDVKASAAQLEVAIACQNQQLVCHLQENHQIEPSPLAKLAKEFDSASTSNR